MFFGGEGNGGKYFKRVFNFFVSRRKIFEAKNKLKEKEEEDNIWRKIYIF